MKILKPVNIQVCSRRVLLRPARFLALLQFYEFGLPELKPTVFNWTDPINKKWELSHYENYLPPDRFGDADNIYWRRRNSPQAEGCFRVGRRKKENVCDEYHSGISLVSELGSFDISHTLDYIKKCSVQFDGILLNCTG